MNKMPIILITWLLVTIGWIVTTELSIKPREYKKGQVDALTGNIKYELITHPDSTKTWEEIGE